MPRAAIRGAHRCGQVPPEPINLRLEIPQDSALIRPRFREYLLPAARRGAHFRLSHRAGRRKAWPRDAIQVREEDVFWYHWSDDHQCFVNYADDDDAPGETDHFVNDDTYDETMAKDDPEFHGALNNLRPSREGINQIHTAPGLCKGLVHGVIDDTAGNTSDQRKGTRRTPGARAPSMAVATDQKVPASARSAGGPTAIPSQRPTDPRLSPPARVAKRGRSIRVRHMREAQDGH